jgi:rhamnogalacturonan endolyase
MATDPSSPQLFTRQGTFGEYDSLQLYYVGMGGNSNTTTRFRKYDGQGNKALLQEYKDADHLLIPGKTYDIKIIVQNATTSFWVDGIRYFRYTDSIPLKEGYFGFRSVHSRQEIEQFRIYKLK